jgi:hypothetical protein
MLMSLLVKFNFRLRQVLFKIKIQVWQEILINSTTPYL